MIHDDIKNIAKYVGIIPADVIDQIKTGQYKTAEIELKNIAEKTFEMHKKVSDLFLVTKGIVKFQYAITDTFETVTEYNEKSDCQTMTTADYNEIILEFGEFLVIDAEVLHKPNLKLFEGEDKYKATVAIIKFGEIIC